MLQQLFVHVYVFNLINLILEKNCGRLAHLSLCLRWHVTLSLYVTLSLALDPIP